MRFFYGISALCESHLHNNTPMTTHLFYAATKKIPLTPLFFLFAGFLPVTAIVIHCLGILPLRMNLHLVMLPAIMLLCCLSLRDMKMGKLALQGWLSGVGAVALYDLSRIPFIMNGWSDFIPKIGGWLNETGEPDALTGYLWRYIGNGGGLGISFFMFLHLTGRKHALVLNGLLFGLFVFASLIFVLRCFPEAQEMMFRITRFSFAGSLLGHIVYGLTLGLLAVYWKRANGTGKVQRHMPRSSRKNDMIRLRKNSSSNTYGTASR